MEHLIIKTLAGGYVSIVPEDGYKLVHKPTATAFSEAVVKAGQERFFTAVEK